MLLTSFNIIFTAPLSQVEVTINNGRFLSESVVILLCTVTLPSSVSSRESVFTTWFGPNGPLTNSSDVTLSNVYKIASGVFQSSITFANFDPAVDNGEFACSATVISSSPYIIGSSAIARRNVMVTGQSTHVTCDINPLTCARFRGADSIKKAYTPPCTKKIQANEAFPLPHSPTLVNNSDASYNIAILSSWE